jgi:hypothetical protein
MGIEKVLPKMEDLALFLPMLATVGAGQTLTGYNSLYGGPRQPGEPDGPEEFHLVLLDNKRTHLLADAEQRDALQPRECQSGSCPISEFAGMAGDSFPALPFCELTKAGFHLGQPAKQLKLGLEFERVRAKHFHALLEAVPHGWHPFGNVLGRFGLGHELRAFFVVPRTGRRSGTRNASRMRPKMFARSLNVSSSLSRIHERFGPR